MPRAARADCCFDYAHSLHGYSTFLRLVGRHESRSKVDVIVCLETFLLRLLGSIERPCIMFEAVGRGVQAVGRNTYR